MTVSEPCVALSTGVLSPDRRVNYTYGMVLGLGEFLQEQQYVLNLARRDDRALHGSGTVYGLAVGTTRPPGGNDVVVEVGPGMAVDQWGRELVVPVAQCARLGAWLGAQERAVPGSVAGHEGPSGEFTVHVVAAYAECLDDLVPVPGQPCSSSARTAVPSRVRDAWAIDLRWDAPPAPRWNTDRRLARLLAAVEVVAGLDPALSSEPEIVEAVLALPGRAGADPALDPPPGWPEVSTSPSGAVAWQLPAETAAEALDRILTVWTTRVRPQLSPELTAPAGSTDPAVLLATIRFTLAPGDLPSEPVAGADPEILWCADPDDEGRPYLLHTQLIQEMRRPQTAGAPAPSNPPAPIGHPVHLATMTIENDPVRGPVPAVWFHLDRPVSLVPAGTLTVRTEDGQRFDFVPEPTGTVTGVAPTLFSDSWRLLWQPPVGEPFPLADDSQVALLLDPPSVLVGDPTGTLADELAGGLDLVDVQPDGEVAVYGVVDLPAPVAPPTPPPPVTEFVTITRGREAPGGTLLFETWFHPQPVWPSPQVEVVSFERELVVVFEERTQSIQNVLGVGQNFGNVWQVQIERNFDLQGYLRFVFEVRKIFVRVRFDDGTTDELPFVDWMSKAEFTVVGWDPRNATVSAYLRVESQ